MVYAHTGNPRAVFVRTDSLLEVFARIGTLLGVSAHSGDWTEVCVLVEDCLLMYAWKTGYSLEVCVHTDALD